MLCYCQGLGVCSASQKRLQWSVGMGDSLVLLTNEPKVLLVLWVKTQKDTPVSHIHLSNVNYLPRLDSDYLPSCTSSDRILQLWKVSSVSVHPLRRSCAYRTYGQTDWQTWWFLCLWGYYNTLCMLQHGLDFHHAQSGYVMMAKWLSTSEPSMIPEYANQYLGRFYI